MDHTSTGCLNCHYIQHYTVTYVQLFLRPNLAVNDTVSSGSRYQHLRGKYMLPTIRTLSVET